MTYSFLDIVATITGPGGTISLGSGNANAEEAVSIEASEETDNMQIGADGSVVHNLHGSKAGKFIFRLLKTSPQNFALMGMYNFQRTSSLFWGQNTISIANPVSGDSYTGSLAAFVRNPNNAYNKESNTIDWEFNCSTVDQILGNLLNQ